MQLLSFCDDCFFLFPFLVSLTVLDLVLVQHESILVKFQKEVQSR